MHDFDRRSLLRAGAAAATAALVARSGPAWSAPPPRDVSFVEDFDELWRTLGERYCYFGEKQIDWQRVRTLYRPQAERAESTDAFGAVVRRVLAELYDAHTHMWNAPEGAPRYAFSDVLAEIDGAAARIVAIADDSVPAESGLGIGDRIVAIDGRPTADAVREAAPRCLSHPDPAADYHAVNVAVAGRIGKARQFLVQSGGGEPRALTLPVKERQPRPDVEWRRLEGGLGLIVIRSFADGAVATSFDKALAELRDAPGLIIDVRYNGGGDTAVARPIMGRFIKETKPYALMRRRQGHGLSEPWTEMVDPQGPFTYERPVVVLTSHWSASMAEGFPMGMRGIGRATLVGTPMMGLGAGVFAFRLDRTGIEGQYSGEPIYDIHGRSRSLLQPDRQVRDGDDILSAGIAELSAQVAGKTAFSPP